MRGFLAAFLLLAACGTTQSVRPLGAGRSAVDLSIGGPLITSPFVAPVPVTVAGYRRGLDDRSDAFGRVHVIPAMFRILGVDAGASRLLLRDRGLVPALNASAQAMFFAGRGGVMAVPAASLTASWATGPWLLYAGTQHAVSFGRMLEGSGALFHWSPYVGASRDVGRWTYGAELRWLEANVGSDTLVWWQGMGGRGAIAPSFSIARKLGGSP